MKNGTKILSLIVIVLSGCAANPLPSLSANHPANASGPSAPPPAASEGFTTPAANASSIATLTNAGMTTSGIQMAPGAMQQHVGPSGAASPTASPAPAVKAIYTCPMHPEIHSDKPGKCPICGMNLVLADQSKTQK